MGKVVDHPLLETFKERMRIFHGVEDHNLAFILKSSQEALDKHFGLSVLDKAGGQELVIERSRFVYNDKLELFAIAFQVELARFAVNHTLEEIKDESNNS